MSDEQTATPAREEQAKPRRKWRLFAYRAVLSKFKGPGKKTGDGVEGTKKKGRLREGLEVAAKGAEHVFHFTFALAILGLLIYVLNESWQDKIEIQEVQVPKEMEEAGYTPAVVSDRIKTTIRNISNSVHSPDQPDFRVTAEDTAPDFEIPETKLPVKSLISIVRRFLGKRDTQIDGHIIRRNELLDVTIRVRENGEIAEDRTVHLSVADTDFEGVIARSAEAIMSVMDPFSLGRYYAHAGNAWSAKKLTRLIKAGAESTVDRDRAIAAALVGIGLRESVLDPGETRYKTAEEAFDAAQGIDKTMTMIVVNAGEAAYMDTAEHQLDVSQKALANSRLKKLGLGYLNMADVYLRQTKYDDAIRYCQLAAKAPLADRETRARALERWAEALAGQGLAIQKLGGNASETFRRADAKFGEAVATAESGENYLRWADVLTSRGEIGRVSSMNAKACSVKKPAVKGCLAHAFDVLAAGPITPDRRSEALLSCARALKENPADPSVLMQVGQIEQQLGHLAEAETDYRAALQWSPTLLRKQDVAGVLADLLRAQGRAHEADQLGVPVEN